jgi:uncharacterized membrane protein/mono/diheme cytochrome c family protein
MSRLRPFVLVLALLGLAATPPLAGRAENATPSAAALAPALRQIFERSCADCHDSSRRPKPKAGFGHVLDLDRLAADDDYVVPGRPDQSELHLLLVTDDEDLLMPPRDSDAPPLSTAEIRLVNDWILALGAPEKSSSPPPPQPPAPPALSAPTPSSSALPSPRILFARLHPLLVHFPVALLVVAAGVALLARLRRRETESDATLGVCLAVTALAAPLSAATGWLLASADGHADATVFLHRWLGVALAALSPALWWLHLRARRSSAHPRVRLFLLLALLAAAALVGFVGHTGGVITRGPGYPF